MIENIIIGIVFIGALVYLGNVIRKQFSPTTTGCAGCGGNCQVTKIQIPDEIQ